MRSKVQPALFLSLILCAAALAATPARTVSHARPAGTAQPGPNDRELEAAIRARFAGSKISVNHFTVRVQGGVAIIEGRTEVIQHKGTATRLAKSAGAREVVNRVELSEAARERAAANLAKGRRRVQVRRSEKRSQR